jgi:hypothetical protein
LARIRRNASFPSSLTQPDSPLERRALPELPLAKHARVLALPCLGLKSSTCAAPQRGQSPATGQHHLPCRGGTLSQSADFRDLAEMRAREAKLLLDESEWSGAYYLVGYVVECGLKACLLKDLQSYQMPDKETISKGFTHDIASLTKTANLNGPRDLEAQKDAVFSLNWNVVLSWNESSRYAIWTETQAWELYEAVTNVDHGVLPWLRKHW